MIKHMQIIESENPRGNRGVAREFVFVANLNGSPAGGAKGRDVPCRAQLTSRIRNLLGQANLGNSSPRMSKRKKKQGNNRHRRRDQPHWSEHIFAIRSSQFRYQVAHLIGPTTEQLIGQCFECRNPNTTNRTIGSACNSVNDGQPQLKAI